MDDDSAPCPLSLWLASLCEAFPGRFPTEVLAEYDRLPDGLLEAILEAGAYREAKALTDRADTPEAVKRLPTTPLFRLVQEIDRDLVQEWSIRQTHGPVADD